MVPHDSAFFVIQIFVLIIQGPATDPADVNRIRELIAKEQAGVVKLINYTSTGRQFMNTFSLIPLQDSTGKVVLYLGAQCEASFPNVDKCMTKINKIYNPFFDILLCVYLNMRIKIDDNYAFSGVFRTWHMSLINK